MRTDSKKAVVCVDDDAIILMSMKAELRNHYKDKIAIETTSSAEEAILIVDELIAEGIEILAIISDWNLPTMKGDELLKIIKKKHSQIGLVMVTGQADQNSMEDLQNSIKLTAVLSKPWDRLTLIKYIDLLYESR